ncbi:phage holin family protein [Exiguobacterium sp. s21]|uniref:phage holin family protein n=1 Tax=Exiguobacterium sp. s21 TaxID=2751244 RepID=UPI001BE9281E|nr:phage holin family protein [Exiguobacterium sp. s21]
MRTQQALEGAVAIVATSVTALLGGWDVALKLLVTLMVIDYVSGFLAALKHKRLNSDVMFWGGIRKGVVFGVIIIAVLADEMLNNSNPVLRTLVIYYYIAREALSVTENSALIGVPMPEKLVEVLAQLQGDKPEPTIDRIALDVAPLDEQVKPVSREIPIDSELAEKEVIATKEEDK